MGEDTGRSVIRLRSILIATLAASSLGAAAAWAQSPAKAPGTPLPIARFESSKNDDDKDAPKERMEWF